MPKEKQKLTKNETADIEIAKAGFTREEIIEMDRRANNIGKAQSFTSDEILKILGFEKE